MLTGSDMVKMRPELAGLYSFAVVRNPWDWVSSFYRFIAFSTVSPDTGKTWEHHLHKHVSGMCFDEFVEWVVFENGLSNLSSVKKSTFSGKKVRQGNWLSDEEGRLIVDKCFRLEALGEEWKSLSDEIGVPLGELPFNNGSRMWENKTSYSSRSRQLVGEYFEKDIDQFGY